MLVDNLLTCLQVFVDTTCGKDVQPWVDYGRVKPSFKGLVCVEVEVIPQLFSVSVDSVFPLTISCMRAVRHCEKATVLRSRGLRSLRCAGMRE